MHSETNAWNPKLVSARQYLLHMTIQYLLNQHTIMTIYNIYSINSLLSPHIIIIPSIHHYYHTVFYSINLPLSVFTPSIHHYYHIHHHHYVTITTYTSTNTPLLPHTVFTPSIHYYHHIS